MSKPKVFAVRHTVYDFGTRRVWFSWATHCTRCQWGCTAPASASDFEALVNIAQAHARSYGHQVRRGSIRG